MMKLTCLLKRHGKPTRRQRSSWVNPVEFSLRFLLFPIIITALISLSWTTFVKRAVQYAVKVC
jgi:hypothetical protein